MEPSKLSPGMKVRLKRLDEIIRAGKKFGGYNWKCPVEVGAIGRLVARKYNELWDVRFEYGGEIVCSEDMIEKVEDVVAGND